MSASQVPSSLQRGLTARRPGAAGRELGASRLKQRGLTAAPSRLAARESQEGTWLADTRQEA